MNLVEIEGGLVVLDLDRRTYVGLARDGTYYHFIRPARVDDPRVVNGVESAGALICSCPGGTYRGTCWRLDQARAHEATLADRAWGLVPA